MKTKWLWGVAAVLLLGLSVWAFLPQPMMVEEGLVRVARFERFIQDDGKTQLRERYVVSSPLQARVQRLSWKPGDRVRQGTVLATLWPLNPALLDARALDNARARLGVAQAGVLSAQANVARAQAAAQQAEHERTRSVALAQAGFVAAAQSEAATLAARLRLQEQHSAQQALRAAEQEVQAAQAALKTYSEQAQRRAPEGQGVAWLVRSPVDATVLKVVQASEDVVQAGTALLELGNPLDLEVVVDVLTQEAAQIIPGALVQLDPWGGAPLLAGRVRLIEPAAFTKVSALGVQEQRVNVLIDIDSPPAQWLSLGDGFRVGVRIEVQAQDDALLVPVSAVFGQATDAALFVLDKGRARRQGVQVLARNGLDAWVQPAPGTTLPAGTRVVVYPPNALRHDMRVRAINTPAP